MPNTENTIEELVHQHLERVSANKKDGLDADFGDFISGKGRGLVFLPHGPPGVSKTSTAESIAERVKKPLYSLTSGNLGIDPDQVESNLQKHFILADRWGCILLLNEAEYDIMWELQQEQNQLVINAIVSVFLRHLEYYKGILFLATNRVGDIDRAFKSRIHVTLEYKPLDQETSRKIYELRLHRAKDEYKRRSRGFRAKVPEILDWADDHFEDNEKKRQQWNGRQIYNAFQTAIALAEWDSRTTETKPPREVVLRKKHFEKVAEVSAGFDQYIIDLTGRDEAIYAKKTGVRVDYAENRFRTPETFKRQNAQIKARRDRPVSPLDKSTRNKSDDESSIEKQRKKEKRRKSEKKEESTSESSSDAE